MSRAHRSWLALGVGLAVALTTAPAVLAQDELPVPEGALTELGDGEGSLEVVAWAGYVEDGSNDPAYDWVSSFEEATGCQVNVTLGNYVRRDVHADADGQLRPCLGVRRRLQPPDRVRHGPAHQSQPHPQLRRRVRGSQEPAPQHGRRRALRRPARAWCQPAHVQHRRGDAGSGQLGHRLGARLPVGRPGGRQGHRL